MGFSRQEYWSGLPCPPPGDLPDPGIEPVCLTSPALAGRFFTTSATYWEACGMLPCKCGSVWCSLEKGRCSFPWRHGVPPCTVVLALIHAGFLCDRSRSTSGMEGTDSRSRPCPSSVQTLWAPPAPPRSSLPCRFVWVTGGQLPRVSKGNIHAVHDVALAVHTLIKHRHLPRARREIYITFLGMIAP